MFVVVTPLLPFVICIALLIWITRIPRECRQPLSGGYWHTAEIWSLLVLAHGIGILSILGANRDGEEAALIAGFLAPVAVGHCWICARHLTRAGVLNRGSRIVFTLVVMPATVIFAAAMIVNTTPVCYRWVIRTAADMWPNDYQHLGVGVPSAEKLLESLLGAAVTGVACAVVLRVLHVALIKRASNSEPG